MIHVFAKVSLPSKNYQFLPKLLKNVKTAKQAQLGIFKKIYMPRVVFDERSKTGLGSEIKEQQRKCWRKLNLQSIANPAVIQLLSTIEKAIYEANTVVQVA